MSECLPAWVDIVVKLTPAFIALVVGVVASLISFLQYRINRDKLRLDLFGKRLEAFEKLQEFFGNVTTNGAVEDNALMILMEARYKSRFLFGSEIQDHFAQLWKNAVTMRTHRSLINGPGSLPVGPERNKICQAESDLLKWIMDQQTTSHERYAPYLSFAQRG